MSHDGGEFRSRAMYVLRAGHQTQEHILRLGSLREAPPPGHGSGVGGRTPEAVKTPPTFPSRRPARHESSTSSWETQTPVRKKKIANKDD